jgi:hypothetical protein
MHDTSPQLERGRSAREGKRSMARSIDVPGLSQKSALVLGIAFSLAKLSGNQSIVIPANLLTSDALELLLSNLPAGWRYYYENSPASSWVFLPGSEPR